MVTVQRMAMINGINVKVIFNSSWVVDFTSYTMEGGFLSVSAHLY